jgi:hypothetical protein
VLAVNNAFRLTFFNQVNGSLDDGFFKTLRNFDAQFAFLVHSGVCLEWLGKLSGVDKALAIALFWLCLWVGFVRWQAKTNVCNVGGNKTSIFFVRGQKIKIRRVGLSLRTVSKFGHEVVPKSCFKVRPFDGSRCRHRVSGNG